MQTIVNRFFVIVFCMFLLYSCCKEDKLVKLEDSSKFSDFKTGDVVIYKSNLNNMDTFIVQQYGMGKGDCISNEDRCKTKTCWETEYLQIWAKNMMNLTDVTKSANQSKGTDISWNEFQFTLSGDEPVQSLIINGTTYTVYYLFKNIPGKICEFYYSKRYGIVQYRIDSLQTWSIQKINH